MLILPRGWVVVLETYWKERRWSRRDLAQYPGAQGSSPATGPLGLPGPSPSACPKARHGVGRKVWGVGTGGEDVENLKVRLLWDLDPELSQVVSGGREIDLCSRDHNREGHLVPITSSDLDLHDPVLPVCRRVPSFLCLTGGLVCWGEAWVCTPELRRKKALFFLPRLCVGPWTEGPWNFRDSVPPRNQLPRVTEPLGLLLSVPLGQHAPFPAPVPEFQARWSLLLAAFNPEVLGFRQGNPIGNGTDQAGVQ